MYLGKVKEAPEKLSVAIDIALQALDKAEQNPRVVIDMNRFHKYNKITRRCHVNLAGAIMHEKFGEPLEKTLFPSSYDIGWEYVFAALDKIKHGDLDSALRLFVVRSIDKPKKLDKWRHKSLPSYRHDKHLWKTRLRDLVSILKKEGL